MENTRGYTSIYFGENQLSPGLISLSLLSTAHPLFFQQQWVRSSTWFYPRFNLAMDSSPGFGSTPCNLFALFRLAFASATSHDLTLLQSVTRRLIMQKARCQTCVLQLLVGVRFQDLFHPPRRGTFHLSLTVLVHYRSLSSI